MIKSIKGIRIGISALPRTVLEKEKLFELLFEIWREKKYFTTLLFPNK